MYILQFSILILLTLCHYEAHNTRGRLHIFLFENNKTFISHMARLVLVPVIQWPFVESHSVVCKRTESFGAWTTCSEQGTKTGSVLL